MGQMDKKEIQNAYKQRKIVGGVFAIRNSLSGKQLIMSATDLHGCKNRFEFAQKTGCSYLKLQNDWEANGAESFEFIILEELEKPEIQSDKEYKEDIKTLEILWLDKFEPKDLY